MTQETKHTPGPWQIDEDGFIIGVNEYAGCGSHKCQWKNKADERLVKAAPELLDALKYARRFVKDCDTDFIDAAIAKAKGGAA